MLSTTVETGHCLYCILSSQSLCSKERREELRSLLQHQIEISQKQEIQLKLMKRLHEEAIVEKNITIRNLSDLITEKDERIAELTGKPYNPELVTCSYYYILYSF